MDSMTCSVARTNLSGTIGKVVQDRTPVIIRNRKTAVVMMCLDDYQAWTETVYLLRSSKNAKRLIASIEVLESSSCWLSNSATACSCFPSPFCRVAFFHFRFGVENNRKTHVQQYRGWKIVSDDGGKPFERRLFIFKILRSRKLPNQRFHCFSCIFRSHHRFLFLCFWWPSASLTKATVKKNLIVHPASFKSNCQRLLDSSSRIREAVVKEFLTTEG